MHGNIVFVDVFYLDLIGGKNTIFFLRFAHQHVPYLPNCVSRDSENNLYYTYFTRIPPAVVDLKPWLTTLMNIIISVTHLQTYTSRKMS